MHTYIPPASSDAKTQKKQYQHPTHPAVGAKTRKKGRGCNRRGSNPGPQLVPCMGGWNAKPLHHGCPFVLGLCRELLGGRSFACCRVRQEDAVQRGDAGAARSFLFAFASPPTSTTTRADAPRDPRGARPPIRARRLSPACPRAARRRKAAERDPGLFASKTGHRRAWPR
ncbi:hypothetical protein LY76DRAFT_14715 [Colletotrichum caudatum]|nr:hypothetical protein LY76DRAFT_14715 [Colletotrichum caudatum]